MRSRRSSNGSDEFTVVARKPSRTSASTSSFMSEMSGEITRTEPGRIFAGTSNASEAAPLAGAGLAIAEDGLEHLLRVGVARGVEQRGAGVEHEVFPVRVRVEGPDYSPGSGVTVGSPRSVQPRQPPSSETTFV